MRNIINFMYNISFMYCVSATVIPSRAIIKYQKHRALFMQTIDQTDSTRKYPANKEPKEAAWEKHPDGNGTNEGSQGNPATQNHYSRSVSRHPPSESDRHAVPRSRNTC